MTGFSRSVFSHSAPLFLSVTSFARPVLQTSLRRLARIEDHVLEYCARRQTRRGPERPLDLAPLRSAAQETAAHFTPARPRRGSGLRKLAARTLGIGITTVILLGLIGVQEARAQVHTTTALYSPGGTIAVGNLLSQRPTAPITGTDRPICPHQATLWRAHSTCTAKA